MAMVLDEADVSGAPRAGCCLLQATPGTFLHRQGRAQDLEARRVKNGTHDGMLRPCLPLVSFMGWEPMTSLTSSRGDGPPEKTAGPRGRPTNFAPEKKNRGGAMR